MSNRHYYSSGRPAGHYNKRYYQKEEKNNEARINRYSSAPDMGDGRRRRFPGNHVLHAPGGALPGYKNNCGHNSRCTGFHPFNMELYTERLAEAQAFCNLEDLQIRLLPGAEIAWTCQVPMALQQGKIPTIGRTDYVLLEFWRDISWQAATDAVNQLTRAGYRPILAHPERYLIFLQSPKKVLRFRHETGVLLQVNANTILNPRNYRIHRFVEYMLQKDGVDAVASDAHNCVSRPVNLEAAYQWLIHHTDAAYARKLVTFGGELV